jgi:hypothetical protein
LHPSRPRGSSRVGVGRSVLAGVVVLVVAAAGLAILYGTSALGPSSLASSTTATSPSTSRSYSATTYTGGHGPGLAIGVMFGDVLGPGSSYLSSNGTTVAGDTIYVGNASETLAVQFDIVYVNCAPNSCPTHVTLVTILDPGFTIVSTKPPYPIPTNTPAGASSGQVEFHFVVNVKAPPSQYNGPLLLVATTQ